jgi:hypothetical protein
MLSSVTWVSQSSGDWDTAGNWSGGAVPGAGDDVTINVAGISITHNQKNSDSINSLTTSDGISFSNGSLTIAGDANVDSDLTLSGGTLDVAGKLSVTSGAAFTLNGGTLSNATVSSGGADLVASSGTLDGVKLDCNLDLTAANAAVTVVDGLTLNGTATINNPTIQSSVGMTFNGDQTLGGVGTVIFGTGYFSFLEIESGTLTIGPAITLVGGNAGIFDNGGAIVNQGTIDADGDRSDLFLSLDAFRNQGTIEATNGGSLDVSGLTGSLGIAVLTGPGSELSIDGTNYSVDSSLSITNGQSLSLLGSWMAGAGDNITATDATLELGTPGDPTQNWSSAGTISADQSDVTLGGTVMSLASITVTSSTVDIIGAYTTSQLAGVFNGTNEITIDDGAVVDNTGSTVTLDGPSQSLILAGEISGGTINAINGADVIVTGSDAVLDSVTLNSNLDLTASGASATILDGLTLNGTAVIGDPNGHHSNGLYFEGDETVGGIGTIQFGPDYSNFLEVDSGTLTIAPGITVSGGLANVYVYGTALVNQGAFDAADSGSHIAIYADSLGNEGTIEAANGGLLGITGLTGGSTAAVVNEGTIESGGNSSIYVDAGSFDNQGTVDADGSSSSQVYANSFSNLGTLAATNGGYLAVNGMTGSLGTAILSDSNSRLFVDGMNYTVDSSINVTDNEELGLSGTWTGAAGTNITVDSATLVLGTIDTGFIGDPTQTWNTSGSISVANAAVYLGGNTSSLAALTAVGSSIDIVGNYTGAQIEPLVPDNTLTIGVSGGFESESDFGAVDNTGNTLTLDGPDESLTLSYGEFQGGAIDAINGAKVIVNGFAGLDDVTLNGNLDATDSSVDIGADGLTLNGTASIASTNVFFDGSSLDGTGTMQLDGSDFEVNGGLTIGPGITLVGHGDIDGFAGDELINQGVIVADDSGFGFSLNIEVINTGTIEATSGESINVLSVDGNEGTIKADAGSVITIQEEFSQGATGVVDVEVGGTSTSQFGRINIIGVATLDGTLNVDEVNGFSPQLDDRFTVLTYALAAGIFANYEGLGVSPMLSLQPEYNRSNLTLNTVVSANVPDLQVTNLAVSPTSPESGQRLTINWNDENTGSGDTSGNWIDSVLIVNLTTGQTLLGGANVPYIASSSGNIAVGGISAKQSYIYLLPEGAAGVGLLQITVTTNANGELYEYNSSGTATSNNGASMTTTSTLASYPDLTVDNIGIQTASPQSGSMVTLQWDDNNIGDATVNTPFDDAVSVQRVNADGTVTEIASGTVHSDATVAAGASIHQDYPFILPDGAVGAGNFLVTVTTDFGQMVTEYDSQGNAGYNNNQSTANFSSTLANYADVTVANLAIASPTSPHSGRAVTVGWDDENIGDGDVNSAFNDSVIVQRINDDKSLTTISSGSVDGDATLAAGASSAQSFTFTLPDGAAGAGTFVITVTSDSGQTVKEYDASGNRSFNNNSTAVDFTSTVATLPDLVVSNVTAPDSGYDNSSLVVSWTVTNSAQCAASGSWLDDIYLDPFGGPQSATPADSVSFSGTVDAGQSYSENDTLTAPAIVGQYTVRVVTDTNQAIQELDYTNNTGSSTQPFDDQAGYLATVTTTVTTVSNGTPIPLSGSATLASSGAPAANVPVAVGILVAGTKRTLTATSDANGNYSITFQPLQYEGGEYSVTAADPGVTNPTVQTQFQIIGMTASPANASVQIIPGTTLTGQITLTDLTATPLTGLTATANGGPAGLTVDLTPPSQIAGSGTATLTYNMATSSTEASSGVATIQVTSAEGAVLDISINVSVLPLTPILSTTSGSLQSGMVVGAQSLVTFTVVNNGGAASGDLQVRLPSTSYLSLASPAIIPSLAPGASSTVTLELNPPADLPLDEYTGTTTVGNSQAGISVPFTFTAITTAVGAVHVVVDDDLTTQESGSPHLTGATVKLLNAYDNSQVVASGTTDATGVTTIANVPAGPYVLEITADGHATYEGSYTVVAGITNTIEPFLQRQLVTYSWNVQPTPIADSYEINLKTTFVDNTPGVTITAPAFIPILAPGQSGTFNVTLTNLALIDAQGVTLNLPSDPEYTFTALSTQIGTLPAKGSVDVPILVTRSQTVDDSADGSRTLVIGGSYYYVFGTRNVSDFFMTAIQVPGRTDSAGHVADVITSANAIVAKAGMANVSIGGGFNQTPTASILRVPALVTASISLPMTLELSQGSTPAGAAVTGELTLKNEQAAGELQNIALKLSVTDSSGNSASGVFYISDPMFSGSLSAVDGTGVLPALSSGSVAYTFIPGVTAAPKQPTVYYIGGTLLYTDPGTGGTVTIPLVPYPLTVNPVPQLDINYFLQKDIVGDDPSTPKQVEPSEPAVLGMLVTNSGAAPADQLSMGAAQPQVVESESTAPLNFQIIGSQVGNQPATPSLTANFGDVQPGQTADAAFFLLSSLQGELLNFTATFDHTAPGGMQTSVIRSIHTHVLIHAGDFAFPGSTGAIDYLVNDSSDPTAPPDTVYLSDGSTAPVFDATDGSANGTISDSQLSVQVTAQAATGWEYIQLPDPGPTYFLSKVIRPDGTTVPLNDQAWTTNRTFDSKGDATVDPELHILDLDSTGSYTVYYQKTPVTPPNNVAPTALAFNRTAGGVDFGYQVSNGPLLQGTTVALYWSSSAQFSGIIGNAVYTTNIPVGAANGSYGPFNVPPSVLGTAPEGAAYVLAVTDPDNTLGNLDASMVQSLPLPQIVLNTVSDNFDQNDEFVANDVTLDYTIADANIIQPLVFDVYESDHPSVNPQLLDDSTVLLAQDTIDPSTDLTDLSIGTHEITLSLTTAIDPDASEPNLVVVANANAAIPETSGSANVTSGRLPYTPAQVSQAYGIASLKANGVGQTIAILDYGDDSTVESDLAQFDTRYKLLTADLRVIGETGGARPTYSSQTPNPVRTAETSGDVEWAHAIAPGAKLVLIELQNETTVDIATALTTAVPSVGANVVSMSFGDTEFPGEQYTVNTSNASISASPGGATESGNTVTITLQAGLYCLQGNLVTISGVGVAGYNGSFPITSVNLSPFGYAVSLTYNDPVTGLAASGGGIATVPAYNDGMFAGSGVTYVASSGDNGQPAEYPAVSPNVIGVGATNLYLNADGSWQSETGWTNPTILNASESGNIVQMTISTATPAVLSTGDKVTISGVTNVKYNGGPFQISSVTTDKDGYTTSFTYVDNAATGLAPSSNGSVTGKNNGGSGGGVSAYETEPAYEANAFANKKRGSPDVSFIGGRLTPVVSIVGGVVSTFDGTSLSAPCWAGLIANADQGLSDAGEPLLTSASALAGLYSLPSTDFHDITSGFNGSNAVAGYDLVSGIGTPIAKLLIPDLVRQESRFTTGSLQALLDLNSTPTLVAADDAILQADISAINGLVAPASPAIITVDLCGNCYSDVDIHLPVGVTVDLTGNGASTNIVGASPAVTVSAGTVIVSNMTLTTATDAPTVVVTAGSLELRNDDIEESRGFTDAAVSVTGGILDLGTSTDPGNNTFNINGTGEFVHNVTQNVIPAVGDTFELNGTPLSAPYLSFTALATSAYTSIFGQVVTLSTTVTPDSTGVAGPTGSVDFFDTTTNTDMGSVELSSGMASLNISTLAIGGNVLVAMYSGDENYLPSIDSVTETVTPATLTDTTAPTVISATEGVASANVTLMKFTDANPDASASNFSIASVNWGAAPIGAAPKLSVIPDPLYSGSGSGWIVVADSVTYPEPGSYPVSLTIDDDSDGNSVRTSNTSFSVVDAALMDTSAAGPFAATEGLVNTEVTLMTFNDANPNASAADFSVKSLTWGGGLAGNAPTVSIVADLPHFGPGSGWKVVASAVAYAEKGMYTVSLTVHDADGTDVSTSKTSFNVEDAVLTDTTASEQVAGTEGHANTNVVLMTFADANPFAPAGDFSIKSLNWGGALAGPAPKLSIVANPLYSGPGSGWKVAADSVIYADKGSYTASLTVHDADGNDVATSRTKFNVADAPLTDTTSDKTLNATRGKATGYVVLGTFTDGNPYATSADFNLGVDWGSGTVSGTPTIKLLLVSTTSAGSNWALVANFTYIADGTFTPIITVTDADGSTMTTKKTKFKVTG